MASYTRKEIIDLTEGKDGSRYSRVDFTQSDFSGLDLSHINFLSSRTLPASNFSNTDMNGSTTRNTLFEGVMTSSPSSTRYTNFQNASMSKLNAYSTKLFKVQTDYNTVKFDRVIANDSDFHNCIFRNAYFINSIFYRCDFSFCDFTQAKFENFYLQSQARDTTFYNCNFDDTFFFNTDFINNVEFNSCSFKNARILYAKTEDFQNLAFRNCNLTSLILNPAINSSGNITFENCNLSGATIPDQSQIMNGVTVRYEGTSEPKHVFRYLAYFN